MLITSDERIKVSIKFPRNYKNWRFIIEYAEQFLKIHGYVAFVTPAFVEEFSSEPELPKELMDQLIEHVLLMIAKKDKEING